MIIAEKGQNHSFLGPQYPQTGEQKESGNEQKDTEYCKQSADANTENEQGNASGYHGQGNQQHAHTFSGVCQNFLFHDITSL